MVSCLHKEKDRIKKKEMELRNRVFGIEQQLPEELQIKETKLPIQEKPRAMEN
jgi:hypothetical protein